MVWAIPGLPRYLPDEDPRVHMKGPQAITNVLRRSVPCCGRGCPSVLACLSWHRVAGGLQGQPQAGWCSSGMSVISTALWVRCLPFPDTPISHKRTLGLPRSRGAGIPTRQSALQACSPPRRHAPTQFIGGTGCELLTG